MGVVNKHQTTSLVLARHEDLAWLNWLLLISSCQRQSVCHSTQCYKMFDYQNCIYIIKFQCQVHTGYIFANLKVSERIIWLSLAFTQGGIRWCIYTHTRLHLSTNAWKIIDRIVYNKS